jgi:hypothetical protein
MARLAGQRKRCDCSEVGQSRIVTTLNQFNDVQLVIADPWIAHNRIAGPGYLPLTDPVAFANSLGDIEARSEFRKNGPEVIRLYKKGRARKHPSKRN